MDSRGRSREISPIAVARRNAERRAADDVALNAASSTSITSSTRRHSRSRSSSSQMQMPLRAPSPTITKPNTSSSPPSTASVVPPTHASISHRSPSPSPMRSVTPPTDDSAEASNHGTDDDADASSIHSDSYYDSPPSPPHTLEDQVHVAYALDDMHLAKVLLLKLKGIEVTSDDDPRIDEVQDEDFAPIFVPEGLFGMDEKEMRESEKREKEARARRETEMKARMRREERLLRCERIWEESKQWMLEWKVWQLQEQERMEREAEEEAERRRVEEERRLAREAAARERALRFGRSTRLLSYELDAPTPGPSTAPTERSFQYTVPTFITPHSPPSGYLSSPKARRREILFQQHLNRAKARAVSFRDVLIGMHGPLFPEDPRSAAAASSSSAVSNGKKRSSVQAELLDGLLKVVEWEDVERRKGKGKAVERCRRRASSPCLCSLATQETPDSSSELVPSSSSTATVSSRAASWLSFGSTRSSTSTALSSVASGSVFSSSSLSKKPGLSLLPAGPSSSAVPSPVEGPKTCSCYCRRHHSPRLVPVATVDYPLSVHKSNSRLPDPSRGRTLHQDPKDDARIGGNLFARVSRIAGQLQKAYVRAAMFRVVATFEYERGSTSGDMENEKGKGVGGNAVKLSPPGYRVRPLDVHTFLSAPSSPPTTTPYALIPLVPPRSTLPTLRPPSSSFVALSPYRRREPPTSTPEPRLRLIGNPVALRLQALYNWCCDKNVVWEGRTRDGMLGCGRERMAGVAWEGRARSGLGVEIRVGEVV